MRRLILVTTACSVLVASAFASGVATRDTTYLLGGPDRWDGRFETPDGQPAWHGWTSAEGYGPHWQVSSYNVPSGGGNYAMWCGKTFANGCAEGYGNFWFDELGYSDLASDPTVDYPVRLEGVFNLDTEAGYDHLQFQMKRGESWETIAGPYSGHLVGQILDVTVIFHPGDFGGPSGNVIGFRAVLTTDAAGSDEDCLLDTQGACQIDNLRVTHPNGLQRFEDFEDQLGEYWQPDMVPEFAAPQLTANLPDPDPDQDNTSWQVNWRGYYDPPGEPNQIFHAWIYSPALEVPDLAEAMILSYDLAWNAPQAPFLFYQWHVRSTASSDPAELDAAEWMNRDFVYSATLGYHRVDTEVIDLLVPGARWMQVSIEAFEFTMIIDPDLQGNIMPYFDNVAVKAAGPGGTTDVPEDAAFEVHAYPNPFNPRTTISFTMAHDGSAALDVFDLRGHVVRRLLAQDFLAGPHAVRWDGTDDTGQAVAAGTYLCRTRAGDQQTVTRLMLVR